MLLFSQETKQITDKPMIDKNEESAETTPLKYWKARDLPNELLNDQAPDRKSSSPNKLNTQDVCLVHSF